MGLDGDGRGGEEKSATGNPRAVPQNVLPNKVIDWGKKWGRDGLFKKKGRSDITI